MKTTKLENISIVLCNKKECYIIPEDNFNGNKIYDKSKNHDVYIDFKQTKTSKARRIYITDYEIPKNDKILLLYDSGKRIISININININK